MVYPGYIMTGKVPMFKCWTWCCRGPGDPSLTGAGQFRCLGAKPQLPAAAIRGGGGDHGPRLVAVDQLVPWSCGMGNWAGNGLGKK